MKRITCLLAIISSILCGCEGKRHDKYYALLEDLLQYPEVRELVSKSGMPIAEFKKLQQVEYHVVSLDGEQPEQIERQLNELGKERWDCFHISQQSKLSGVAIVAFCKRRPDTPLSYVPQTLIRSYFQQ